MALEVRNGDGAVLQIKDSFKSDRPNRGGQGNVRYASQDVQLRRGLQPIRIHGCGPAAQQLRVRRLRRDDGILEFGVGAVLSSGCRSGEKAKGMTALCLSGGPVHVEAIYYRAGRARFAQSRTIWRATLKRSKGFSHKITSENRTGMTSAP